MMKISLSDTSKVSDSASDRKQILVPMSPTLQRDLINFLRPLPQFESENSRKALLITAGLNNNIIASIELRGSADEFVPLLVRRLETCGDMADDEPALVALLRSLAEKLGQEKKAAIREFCARLLDDEPARLMARCPYRGLEAFREQDEQYFFGRDTYAAKLVEAVQRQSFVAVLGASGSGKSSLVFAGVIPILRCAGNWQIATLRPLTNPFYEMASAMFPLLDPEANEVETMRQIEQLTAALQANEITLAGIVRRIARKSPASRLLIAIDQFEELYAPENAATCRVIIEQLLQLIADASLPVSVVITLRSDFLGQTNSHPDFSHLIADHNLLVPAMNADELRAAIAEPAQKAGQPLSAEVVDLLIEQTKEREGALPLLEFALTQIWQGMAQNVEPAETLTQIGGVGGALANKAKELFDSLTPAEQQIARRAFLAMTRLGEGTNDTRRRAALTEMVSHQDAPDNVRNVLRLFAQPGARLLTLTEDAAEITHEALFEHWHDLKTWIDQNRDDLRFLRQVNDAAQHWDAQGRPEGSLWRRPNLDLLKAFHTRAAADMTALQVAFFQESGRKEKQTRLRKRMTWAGLVLLTVISVITAMWAIWSERIAKEERQKAEINEIEGLNQTAKALFASNDELNALLSSIKAGKKLKNMKHFSLSLKYRTEFNFKNILSNIFQKNRLEGFRGYRTILSYDGTILASIITDESKKSNITLWDLNEFKEINTLNRLEVYSATFSLDNKMFAVSDDTTIKILNVYNGEVIRILQSAYVPEHIIFNSDGTMLVSASIQRINDIEFKAILEIWNIAEGKIIKTLQKVITSGISYDAAIQFSPNDQMLVLNTGGSVYILNIQDGNETANLQISNENAYVTSMAFSPNGNILALGNAIGEIKLWDINREYNSGINNIINRKISKWQEHFGRVNDIIFNLDGSWLVSGGNDGSVKIREILTGQQIKEIKTSVPIIKVRLNSSNTQLITEGFFEYRGIYKLEMWDITKTHRQNVCFNAINWTQIGNPNLYNPLGIPVAYNNVQFNPDGTILAIGGKYWKWENVQEKGGIAILWNIKDAKPVLQIREPSFNDCYVTFRNNNLICVFYDSEVSESTLIIHNMEDGRETRKKLKDASAPFTISPDGKILVSANRNNNTLKVYQLEENQESFRLQGHLNVVKSITFNKSGSILASGGMDKTIKLWDITNGKELLTLQGHTDTVNSVAFSPDNTMLASSSQDTTIKLWNTLDGRQIGTLQESQLATEDIVFNQDNTLLVSITGYEVKLWDVLNKNKITTLLTGNPATSYLNLSFSPDDKMIAIAQNKASVGDILLCPLDFLDDMLLNGCEWLQDYLKNPYANLSNADRAVCDDILHKTN